MNSSHKYLQWTAMRLALLAVAATLGEAALLWLRVLVRRGSHSTPLDGLPEPVAAWLMHLAEADALFWPLFGLLLAIVAISSGGALWLALQGRDQ